MCSAWNGSKEEKDANVRAVVQRVVSGSVSCAEEEDSPRTIGPGLVVLLGVGVDDTKADATYLAEKIANLRIFNDEDGKMNLSLLETGGEVLAVSQFTLYGDVRRGRRPSFINAAAPEEANDLYEYFVSELRRLGVPVKTGWFQKHMLVSIENDGPVTILVDSHKQF